jgi:hypothetical protein
MQFELWTLYMDLAITFLVMVMSLCGAVGGIIFIYALTKWRMW